VIETRLKYCIFDPDPNGNERYYVRKPGHRKIRIRETFKDVEGRITPAFMKAYFEALEALDGKRAAPQNSARDDVLLAGRSVLSFIKIQKLRSANPG
jgi:hypothetical protein